MEEGVFNYYDVGEGYVFVLFFIYRFDLVSLGYSEEFVFIGVLDSVFSEVLRALVWFNFVIKKYRYIL